MATARAEDVDAALTALYREHYASLVRLAGLLLRNRAVAEEVVQDAFVGLLRRWSTLRDQERAAAYLRSATINGVRSVGRRASTVSRVSGRLDTGRAYAEDPAGAVVSRATVLDALAGLPERQREVLVLRYYGTSTKRTSPTRWASAAARSNPCRARAVRAAADVGASSMTSHDERELELRLRRVLQEEAATMSPDPNGLEQIRAQASQPADERARPGWLWPTLAAAAVAAVVVGFIVIPGLGDDDEPEPATSPSPQPRQAAARRQSPPRPPRRPRSTPATPTAQGGASTETAPTDAFMVIEFRGPGSTVDPARDRVAFEATVNWELRTLTSGARQGLRDRPEGGPGRGTWEVTSGPGYRGYVFEAYEASAEDGRNLHIATATFTIS